MKISVTNGGGRVVPEVGDLGRKGKRVLNRRDGSKARGATNGWFFPWHRADGNGRLLACERSQVARSGRYAHHKGRVVMWPNGGRRVAEFADREGKFRPENGSGRLLRSYADVVAGPAGDSSKGGTLAGGAPQGLRKVENEPVPLSASLEDLPRPSTMLRSVGTKDGKPSISFSAAEIDSGIKKFRNSIVLKFLSERPPEIELKRFISCQWKVNGEFHFSEIWDSSHVVVLFHSEAEVKKALKYHIRNVGSCRFKVFRWTAEYDPKMQDRLRRVWVNLPDLPLFLYDIRFAEVIISGFAKLIRLDKASESCRNLKRMRVRIELDEDKVIPDMIWINLPNRPGVWQKIEVEGSVCSICCNVHHLNDKCAIVNEGINSDAGVGLGDDLSIGVQIDSLSDKPVEDQWQLVSRSKKKRGAASSKDTVLDLGKEEDVPPINATSTPNPSNISAELLFSTGGNLSVAEESSKSLAIVDNRHTYPSNAGHAPCDVGQCVRLELSPTCDMQSPSQIGLAMAKDYKKKNIAPSCNKKPSAPFEAFVDHDIVCAGGPNLTTHETQKVVPSKVGYGKEVGSTSSSCISNVGKQRDGQAGCLRHNAPINAAAPFPPSVNSNGYLTASGHYGSAMDIVTIGTSEIEMCHTAGRKEEVAEKSSKVAYSSKEVAPCDSLDL